MYLNFSVLWAFVGNGKLNLFLLMVFTAKQTTLILVLCKAAEEQVVFVSTSQPCKSAAPCSPGLFRLQSHACFCSAELQCCFAC